MNKVHQLYYKYFGTYKKEYDSEDLNEEDKNFDNNQYKIPSKKKQKPSIEQPMQLKQLNSNEISKPSWIEGSRKDFDLLIEDVSDSLANKDYKTTLNDVNYDFKKAEEFLLEIGTKKINKNEARDLYNSFIKPDVDLLRKATGKGKGKRNNILEVSNNLESSLFEGIYLHYKNLPKETEFERSIAEGSKFRREKIAEIEREEKNINNELFKEYFTNYQSPSNMYKKLRETEGIRNEDRVYLIKQVLKKMKKKTVRNVPEGNASKIETNEKIIDIVERILYFNQSGQGLKCSAD